MIYNFSWSALAVFSFFVAVVLGISFYLGSKARSAKGYYAAHGGVHWFVNGIAFAGDYLSAASFLGICGMIAFYGYDGFLYSIGYLAGWVVALFVIAEPLKRLGRFTFADALDNRFNSRAIKLTAAISTLVVSIFYLIPQMVGAGALIKPLLGLQHNVLHGFENIVGVLLVGTAVVVIVTTAGMVSTTWVQFIKGSLLVIFCAILTVLILQRGLTTDPSYEGKTFHQFQTMSWARATELGYVEMDVDPAWKTKPYVHLKDPKTGDDTLWHVSKDGLTLAEAQWVMEKGNRVFVNGRPQGRGPGEGDLYPVGSITKLPEGKTSTGPIGPIQFIKTLQESEVLLWSKDKDFTLSDGAVVKVYYSTPKKGSDILVPGAYFKGIKSHDWHDKLDFVSLMLALFCGTASLPHILIRYYTVKDQASARKSTVVGIAAIGFFYVLTLYLGLAAMTSGAMDVTDNNTAAPLLARTLGAFLFAVISAIAFTTVLGTVSGLIMAASGAVAHDIMTNLMKMEMDDHAKVRAGKWAAVFVGIIAMVLGVVFRGMNVGFLVGWAFNVAASANLPSLIMLLFWKRTTKQGIAISILIGATTSLAWLMVSAPAYSIVYGIDPAKAIAPFANPGLVTIPLGFVVLVVVSLMTQRKTGAKAFEVAAAR